MLQVERIRCTGPLKRKRCIAPIYNIQPLGPQESQESQESLKVSYNNNPNTFNTFNTKRKLDASVSFSSNKRVNTMQDKRRHLKRKMVQNHQNGQTLKKNTLVTIVNANSKVAQFEWVSKHNSSPYNPINLMFL